MNTTQQLKQPRGRPKKPNALNMRFSLKFDKTTAKQVESAAAARGQTVSHWLREAAARHLMLQLAGSLCLMLLCSCAADGDWQHAEPAPRHEASAPQRVFNWGAAMRAMGDDSDQVTCRRVDRQTVRCRNGR